MFPDAQPLQIPSQQSDDTLMLYYAFQENAGTTLYDLSGNSNNGTLTNFVTPWRERLNGPAINFDGSNDHVTMADIDFGSSNFSVEMFFRPDVVNSINHYFVTGINVGAAELFQIGSDNSYTSRLKVSIEGSGGSQVDSTDDGAVLVAGTWYHLVVVVDRIAETMTRYLDGAQRGAQDDISAVTGTIDSGNWSAIGADNGADAEMFNGEMSLFRIYLRGLTADEVRDLYFSMRA